MSVTLGVSALGLALLGIVLLAVGARGPWPVATAGGLLLGIAVAAALVATGTQPIGAQTSAVVVLGALVGLLAGGALRLRRPRR